MSNPDFEPPCAAGRAHAAGLKADALDREGQAAPGLPAGPDTLLRVFSMTKAVASVAALILADRGRLDLDAPLARYRPEAERT